MQWVMDSSMIDKEECTDVQPRRTWHLKEKRVRVCVTERKKKE